MKKIFFALLALCAFVVTLPSCGEHNTPDKPDMPNDSTDTPGDDSIQSVIAFEVKGITFNMFFVEGGTFMMGAMDGDEEAGGDERPQHKVTLSDFSIGETEVTQELWEAVMGANPSNFEGDTLPVEGVSWNDCQQFINTLNNLLSDKLGGKHFRLPTEAEWEFAARGGNKSKGYKYSGSDNLDDVAWYDSNSGNATHTVKTKSPNELGLYDMSGNVQEWCQDWYNDDYYGNSPVDNPQGTESGSDRANRGGNWCYNARNCRSSNRNYRNPDGKYNYLGLRLVLSK